MCYLFYVGDFKPWDSKRAKESKQPPPPSSYQPPSGPLQGLSNYSADYIPHNITPIIANRPKSKNVTQTLAPFVAESTYREHFRQHGVTPRDDETKRTKKALEEVSNLKTGVIGGRIGSRDCSTKPEMVKSLKIGNKLSHESVAANTKPTYQQWRTQRPYLKEREGDKEEEGALDASTLTTTRREFGRKSIDKVS